MTGTDGENGGGENGKAGTDARNIGKKKKEVDCDGNK